MATIIIDEIFDPIGNSSLHKHIPIIYWQYVTMETRYGIQLKWITPQQDDKNMYYTIDMHCTGMKNAKAIWKISKDNFYIDNIKPEDHISMLAIESTAPYYPFEFMATKEGQIDSIINIDTVQKRFVQAKPILLRNYEGDIAVEYIEAIENVLHDSNKFKSIITKDIWLSLFFASITGEYAAETKTKEVIIEFPFFGFEDLFVFKGAALIMPKTNEVNGIRFLGSLVMPAIAEDIIALDGRIEIIYDLDIETCRIRNIMCDVIINTEQGEYKVIVDGYEITEKKEVKIKEEKPKQKPVGWMAFFSKD